MLAAAAMVATLPGRTHGLGLIAEPVMADLGVERVAFAVLNFWATTLGALCCLPVGWLVDRVGGRAALAAVLAGLGVTVLAMAGLERQAVAIALPAPEAIVAAPGIAVPGGLFALVLLTRGLGQSALSVVSLAIVGKAAGDRPGVTMGLYSFLVAVGFMAAFIGVKVAYEQAGADWRDVWSSLGWALLVFAAVAAWSCRGAAERDTIRDAPADSIGATLPQAAATPAFWVFAAATSFYGLVASGLSLFNQSLLAERGFDRGVFLSVTALAPLIGLAANLAGGWLASRLPLGRVAAAALGLQAGALAAFPHVGSIVHVYAYAAAMAVAGGLLTVVFFTVWRQAFGPAHLGGIQGLAQLLTVVASAAGPVLLAAGQRTTGSYAPVVLQLAAVSAGLAGAVLMVPLPVPRLQGEAMDS